jgi:hypothetical protein
MEWDRIELDWNRYRPLAREKWRRIPPSGFDGIQGSRERLIEVIERYYDVSRDQARREVNYWTIEAPRLLQAQTKASESVRRDSGRLAPPRPAAGKLVEAGGRIAEQAAGQIQAHPVATLLVGLGLGMLLAAGMARRAE